MTWILLYLLLWMAFRMLLSLGRAESAENPPLYRVHSARLASGHLRTRSTDDDDG
jgi:hypothetical protein